MSNEVETMKQLTKEWENQLPTWAISLAHDMYVIGAQLRTRDGRRTGNGVILEATLSVEGWLNRVTYEVLTDAGNRMILTAAEIDELFWPPKYIMEIMSDWVQQRVHESCR